MSVSARDHRIGDDWFVRPSGLVVPTPAPRRSKPIAIDVFCGAGGFSLGLIAGGVDVIAAIDNDANATMTYLHNLGAYPVDLVCIEEGDKARLDKAISAQHKRDGWIDKQGNWTTPKDIAPEQWWRGPTVSGANRHRAAPDFDGVRHFFFGDIRKITGQQVLDRIGLRPGDVDLVVGGPPCQGFSTGGKRNVMDPRNSLVFEWARFVLDVRPKAMVMENVPGILNMVTPEGVPVVDALARVLADGDFGAFDALKKSLLTTAGCGGALRDARSRGDDEEPDDEGNSPPPIEQQSLWSPA